MRSSQSLLAGIEPIALEAGEAIMSFYQTSESVAVQTKSDNSPVTAADFAANDIIVKGLQALTPEWPIISEELPIPDYSQRQTWRRYWLVDPLDGTKEFIHRNGEFTVNIALIENSVPVLGCVYAPAIQTLYGGAKGTGAWKEKQGQRSDIQPKKLQLALEARDNFRVIGSRSYGIPDLPEALVNQFDQVSLCHSGSSLKLCLVAEGEADLYPRHQPTNEWDTAAAQAVLEAAGGTVFTPSLEPLRYNTKSSTLNPSFYVVGDQSFDWSVLKT